MSVTVNIVGSFGAGAFNPNPIGAAVGNQIVWTNGDTVLHHIVLDSGTDVGDVAPGQSSAPVTLATATAGFHCTLHLSMVGTVGDLTAIPPPPPIDYTPAPPYDYGYY